MLDTNDKKWIRETIDESFDERFADAENRLNKVMDERFADAIETFDRRINERFDAFETRFMLLMENEITPLLRTHAEVIPDTYKSYRNLEDRVEVLEQNYDVLKNVLSSRL